LIYLDTSALVKTLIEEPESAALGAYLDNARNRELISSALLSVETRRGVLRHRPASLPRADLALAGVSQLDVSHAVIEAAGRLPDRSLRSLDAIHLATALLIRDDVEAFVTYDTRLAEAARSHGLPVDAPA
jgi:predicted nucleic acid-binding protein